MSTSQSSRSPCAVRFSTARVRSTASFSEALSRCDLVREPEPRQAQLILDPVVHLGREIVDQPGILPVALGRRAKQPRLFSTESGVFSPCARSAARARANSMDFCCCSSSSFTSATSGSTSVG